MHKEVFPGIYLIEIPLPQSPLKATNSYLVKGNGRNLLIDTGMNRLECLTAMEKAIKALEIDIDKTDLFITHFHADHIGLVEQLSSSSNVVYFGDKVNSKYSGEGYWDDLLAYGISNGFPADELRKSLDQHPGRNFGLKKMVNFHYVGEGDLISVGDFSFQCFSTPGHTPGHMCLYDRKNKILFSGDHILFDITPNITFWPGVKNSLKDYLKSLDRAKKLAVEMVLPGHRSFLTSHQGRIEEIKRHHKQRLKEVIGSLVTGKRTAYEVAPYISWDTGFKSWIEFPIAQKWFAFGETLAHLHYLAEAGKVLVLESDNRTYYRLTPGSKDNLPD